MQFAAEVLREISAQILARHEGNTMQYGATRGYRPLIEHMIGNTLRARGIAALFEDVIITSGSQQGLDLVGRAMIDPGDRVIVEHTNINPNKAAHIGHLRNAILGDTLVRCMKWLGHQV